MIHLNRFVSVGLAAATLSFACSSNDSSSYVRPKGRGSAACQAWQKAICDYATLDCRSNLTEATCVNQYYGVTCLSDEAAQSCATALDSASCASMPANCNASDIADRAPAIAACNGYIDAACKLSVSCGWSGTLEQCVIDAQTESDCSTANSVGLGYETCISELETLPCTASELPTTCKGVIISLQKP